MSRHKKEEEATMPEEVIGTKPVEEEVTEVEEDEFDKESPLMACPGCGATFFHVNHFAKINEKGQMFDEVIDFHCLGCNKNRLQYEDLKVTHVS